MMTTMPLGTPMTMMMIVVIVVIIVTVVVLLRRRMMTTHRVAYPGQSTLGL